MTGNSDFDSIAESVSANEIKNHPVPPRSSMIYASSPGLSEVRIDPEALHNRLKRSAILCHLLDTYQSDEDNKPHDAPVWEAWLAQSGELPPDFDQLPTNAFLPNVLEFDDGASVLSVPDWQRRRQEVLRILETYQLGQTVPPPPKMTIEELGAARDDSLGGTVRHVRLVYGPSELAVSADESLAYYTNDSCMYRTVRLNIEIFIPDGHGPFPAIVEVGNHPSDQLANTLSLRSARRDYVVCIFNSREAFAGHHVYSGHSITELGWWAYAAGRCVDYLHKLEMVDPDKIAVIGHSRGGKMALLAAALDERFCAVIASHNGTGAGATEPWRYAGEKFGAETLESSTRAYPYWNHPRMRFFAGRENKLPFDSHFLMALVAPRPLLVTEGDADDVGEPWGGQQAYLATKEVYDLLGHADRLNIRFHAGGHQLPAHVFDQYIDWLDMQVGKQPLRPWQELMYTYSFDGWRQVTGVEVDVSSFAERGLDDLLLAEDGSTIHTEEAWQAKRVSIRKRMLWMLGELPAVHIPPDMAPSNIQRSPSGLVKAELRITDSLIGHITYREGADRPLPVAIYLHSYIDALGCRSTDEYGWSPLVGERLAERGFLAVEFDQLGYGKRNHDCGLAFYRDHPQQSALGVMIQDVRAMIDVVSSLEHADSERIMLVGFSLGGAVALHAAALDLRIKAVATTCAFGSMRLDTHGKDTEGIQRYSHLRPTLPRLGFFLGHERRVPYDFHEVLAMVAPRPVLTLAPRLDQDWVHKDVVDCHWAAASVYEFLGATDSIRIETPNDFNRYPPSYQRAVNDWLARQAGIGDS